MVTEIVFFKLRPEIDLATLMAKYEVAAKRWVENPDLIHKWYYYDEATHEGGGIYVWRTREAALRWHGPDYQAMVETVYGYPPQIRLLDAVLYVDPSQKTYEILGPAA